MVTFLKWASILSIFITIVFVILLFIFAHLSIIAPTGVESYNCYQSTCFTPSIESRLTGLYFISSIVSAGISALVTGAYLDAT